MDDATLQVINEFVSNPDFCRMRLLCGERFLQWNEFKQLPMPSGLSPEQAWEMLHLIRIQDRIDIGCTDVLGLSLAEDFLPTWFKWSNELVDASHQVSGLIAPDSFLDRKFRKKKRSVMLLDGFTETIGAILQLEKSFLDESEAKDILQGRAQPRCAQGAVLARLRRFLLDEGYRNVNLGSANDLLSLHTQLMHPGPDEQEYLNVQAVTHVAELMRTSPENRYCMSTYTSPGAEIPISIVRRRAFGAGSTIMGCLLARLYFNSLDEVVLANLPIVESQLTPQVAKLACGEGVVLPNQEHKFIFHGTVDKTEFNILFLCMVRDMLLAVRADLKSQEVLEDCLVEIVQRDPRLNMRQIGLLRRFLEDEHQALRLQDHQSAYLIAYATARADLMGLVSMGYLTVKKCGKAFWFYPAENIKQVVLDAWTQYSKEPL